MDAGCGGGEHVLLLKMVSPPGRARGGVVCSLYYITFLVAVQGDCANYHRTQVRGSCGGARVLPIKTTVSNFRLDEVMTCRQPNVCAAVERGDLSSLRRQLKHFNVSGVAILNAPDWDGRTPLITAAAQGRAAIVEELLAAGAAHSLTDNEGLTALMEASCLGHFEIVSLLLRAGADVNVQSASGRTALHKAAYYGHLDICDILISSGADKDRQNMLGGTAIIGAAFKGYRDIVMMLAQKGAILGHRNYKGKKAADYCKDLSLRQYLLKVSIVKVFHYIVSQKCTFTPHGAL